MAGRRSEQQALSHGWVGGLCDRCGGDIVLGEHVLTIDQDGRRATVCWDCASQPAAPESAHGPVLVIAAPAGEDDLRGTLAA